MIRRRRVSSGGTQRWPPPAWNLDVSRGVARVRGHTYSRRRGTLYAQKSYVVRSTSRFMLRRAMLFRGHREDMRRVVR
jgi:hypothetical protein